MAHWQKQPSANTPRGRSFESYVNQSLCLIKKEIIEDIMGHEMEEKAFQVAYPAGILALITKGIWAEKCMIDTTFSDQTNLLADSWQDSREMIEHSG
jgi:hypothetical protein